MHHSNIVDHCREPLLHFGTKEIALLKLGRIVILNGYELNHLVEAGKVVVRLLTPSNHNIELVIECIFIIFE